MGEFGYGGEVYEEREVRREFEGVWGWGDKSIEKLNAPSDFAYRQSSESETTNYLTAYSCCLGENRVSYTTWSKYHYLLFRHGLSKRFIG